MGAGWASLQVPLRSSRGCTGGEGGAAPPCPLACPATSPHAAGRPALGSRPCSLPVPLPAQLWGKYSSKSGRVELLAPGQEVCVPQGQDPSGLFAISV